MAMATRSTALLLATLATLARAAVPDPLPDQPGALTPEDIQAVTSAAQSRLAPGVTLPLVASGKQLPGQAVERYALFATPFVDLSARVRKRTRLLCNFWGRSWRCPPEPVEEFQMQANGLVHLFVYQAMQGPGNREDALNAVDFMYSPCFATQFAALGGTSFTPSPDADYVRSVGDEGNVLGVSTGPFADNNSYRLQKTDKSADGCGFKIENVRIAATGQWLPASYATQMARPRAQQEADHRARERESRPRRVDEPRGLTAMWSAAALAFLSLFAPTLTRDRSPWLQALAAGVLAITSTAMIVIAEANMPGYEIPLQYLLYLATLATAWTVFVVMAIRAAFIAWKRGA